MTRLGWLKGKLADVEPPNICRGLGAIIADKFAAEGCRLAINYNASQDRAEQVAEKIEREYKTKAILIQGV